MENNLIFDFRIKILTAALSIGATCNLGIGSKETLSISTDLVVHSSYETIAKINHIACWPKLKIQKLL